MNVYRRGFRVPTGKILEQFSIQPEATEKQENFFSFLSEQLKISIFFPYYFLRKIYLRIRKNQLAELGMSHFAVRNY
jgi:hypothetical protein